MSSGSEDGRDHLTPNADENENLQDEADDLFGDEVDEDAEGEVYDSAQMSA